MCSQLNQNICSEKQERCKFLSNILGKSHQTLPCIIIKMSYCLLQLWMLQRFRTDGGAAVWVVTGTLVRNYSSFYAMTNTSTATGRYGFLWNLTSYRQLLSPFLDLWAKKGTVLVNFCKSWRKENIIRKRFLWLKLGSCTKEQTCSSNKSLNFRLLRNPRMVFKCYIGTEESRSSRISFLSTAFTIYFHTF